MRALLASVLVAASLLVVPANAQPAAAAGNCQSAAPMFLPILASGHASGSVQWSSDCAGVSGSWTGTTTGGSFTFTNPGGSSNYSGTWTLSGSSGSFTYAACTFCITWQGTWTTMSTGGSLEYTCAGCGDVIGSWTSFSNGSGSFHYGCSGCDATYGNWNSSSFGGSMTLICSTCSTLVASWSWNAPLATPTPNPSPTPTPSPATCTDSVGPGIAPPQGLATGIDGLHAAWYGQSGYPTLCPGHRTTVTFPFLNTGTVGWVQGAPGQTALLGTWNPDPGQDMPSILGGDGTHGSPSTGWSSYDRPAGQPATYVGPGQVAWFQFTIQAPAIPGTYRLAVRPVIEGTTWLEDYGVFVYVTVKTTG